MDTQVASKLAAKLITRSKARKSVDHRKIVNFLDNISRDSTGAPVTWKFNKKGVQFAKGISKKIAKAHTSELKLKRLQDKGPKMEVEQEPKPATTIDKQTDDAKETHTKKKPGRKKKIITPTNEEDKNQQPALKTDNLIISIRRIDDKDPGLAGNTERIVTIENTETEKIKRKPGRPRKYKKGQNQANGPVANSSVKLKTASALLKNSMLRGMKKRPGRPKTTKVIGNNYPKQGPGKQRKDSQSQEPLREALSEHTSKMSNSDALKDLEEAVAIKRGRKTNTWTALNQKTFKKSTLEKVKQLDAPEAHSRESSVSRMDSDIESIDSNTSGISDRRKKLKRYNREGINLGPKKLLRSQDSLMTRRKKVTLSSVEYKHRRKRTLSGEFELLDEKSLKKKIREEEEQNEDNVDSFPESKFSNLKALSSKSDEDSEEKSPFRETLKTQNVHKKPREEVKLDQDETLYKQVHTDFKDKQISNLVTTSSLDSEVTKNDFTKMKLEGNKHGVENELDGKSRKNNDRKHSQTEIKRKVGRPLGSRNHTYSPAPIIRGRTARRGSKSQSSFQRTVKSKLNLHTAVNEFTEICNTESDINISKKGNEKINGSEVSEAVMKPEQKSEQNSKRTVSSFGSLKIIGPGGLQFTKTSKTPVLKIETPMPKIDGNSCENKVAIDNENLMEKHDDQFKKETEIKHNKVCSDNTDAKWEIAVRVDFKEENESETMPQIQEKTQSFNLEKQIIPSLETSENESNIPNVQIGEEGKSTMIQSSSGHEGVPIDDSNQKCLEVMSSPNELATNATDSANTDVEKDSCNVIDGSEAPEMDNETSNGMEIESESSLGIKVQSEEFIANSGVASFLDEQTTFVRGVIDNAFVKTSVDGCDTSILKLNTSLTETNDDNPSEGFTIKDSNIKVSTAICGKSSGMPTYVQEANKDTKSDIGENSEATSHRHGIKNMEQKSENLNNDGTLQNPESLGDNQLESSLSCSTIVVDNTETIHGDNISLKISENIDHSEKNEIQSDEMDSETPGFYFRNVDNLNSTHKGEINFNSEASTLTMRVSPKRSESTPTNSEISENSSKMNGSNDGSKSSEVCDEIDTSKKNDFSVPVEMDDKDDNSRSSESSLDRSSSSLSVRKDENIHMTDSSPETEGQKSSHSGKKTSAKRVFQLRQKASRSPLEIIAMKQSQEERQYILEQTQRAMRREEKQKKMKMNRQRLAMEQELSQYSIEKENAQIDDEEFDFETLQDQMKPCSVVLIDFVKYLKMTEKSQENETDGHLQNWDGDYDSESCPVEDEKTSDSKISDSVSDLKDTSSVALKESENVTKNSLPKEHIGDDKVSVPDVNAKKKKRPSARKQAKSYNFNPKLTAEIVHYPLENVDYDSTSTVPPLRLKIKQNLITEPKRRGKPGRPAKRKARKSMSPIKKQNELLVKKYQEADIRRGVDANTSSGFEGSFVQFLHDVDKPHETKVVFKLNSSKRGKGMRGKQSSLRAQSRQDNPYFNNQSTSSMLKSSTEVMEAYASHENEMIYECTYHECGFKANKEDIIKSHIYVHLQNTPFKCLHCQCIFNSRATAHLHSRSSHPTFETSIEPAEHVEETQYYRQICSVENMQRLEILNNHMSDNIGEFKCTYNNCGFESNRRDHMREHVFLHFKNVPYKCLNCQSVFKSRKAVQMHSRHLHSPSESRFEPADPIDVTQFYTTNTKCATDQIVTPSTPPRQQVQQVQQSPEAVIIKVVLPGNVHEAKGCYCCSYCEFSSSVQHEILNHINENHRPEIQYTCSLCDKQFLGNKEGIARHFAEEHPNQPVMYKSMPDFYDVRKSAEQSVVASGSGPDKGNIFDRISDLFGEQDGDENSRSRRKYHEKTSAEADSTTAENDESHNHLSQMSMYSKPHTGHSLGDTGKLDEIEQMVKEYGDKSDLGMQETTIPNQSSNVDSISSAERDGTPHDKDSQGDGIGLKIVSVMSLRDQPESQYAENVWNETPDLSQSNFSSLAQDSIGSQTNNNSSSVVPGPADAISALRNKVLMTPSKAEEDTPPQAIVSKQSKAKLDDNTCTTYKCEKCNVHAPILATMVEHLRLSHKDIEKLFLCPYCRQYEGATEPDIHRHIKQFHQASLQQKSPPVALSSAAKQHLRTIQVPVGDANKIGDKFMIEKDIYKCLKCNGHMPSLEYIYTHLENQHNEFFVNVCPYCKRFKSKDEEVVFNHIRVEHNCKTDDITLSVAIEENLFTRVQCLTKGKITPKNQQVSGQSTTMVQQTQKESFDDVMVIGETRMTTPQAIRPLVFPYQPTVLMRPNIPSVVDQPLRMPVPGAQILPKPPFVSNMQMPVQNQQLSKSSLRKSRPMHRDRGAVVSPMNDPDLRHLNQSSPVSEASNAPPPLMRAPPPLIRFQQPQVRGTYHSNVTPSSQLVTTQSGYSNQRINSTDSSVRGMSFSMTDRLQRLNALHGKQFSPSTSSHQQTTEASSVSSRHVLRVPNVRSPITSQSSSRPPPYEPVNRIASKDAFPLDLSKPGNDVTSRMDTNDGDDVPPDAFQIFNIRPGAQCAPTENNQNNYNQFQVRPPAQRPIQRMPANIYSAMQRPVLLQPHGVRQVFAPMPGIISPQHLPVMHIQDKDRATNVGSMERRIFKCPYCPQVVPLNYAEVGPHIEKVHPGHSIVFSKID